MAFARQLCVAVTGLGRLDPKNCAGDLRAQDLSRTATDSEHANVACHSLQGFLVAVASRAEKLQGIVDDFERCFGRKHLGACRHCLVGKARAARFG